MTGERALRLVPDTRTGRAATPPPDELLRQWGQWLRAAGGSEKTIKTRVQGIKSLCAHAGGVDPTALTEIDIVDWLADCESGWTRKTYSCSVRQWHAWLLARGYRDDDPTAALPKPPTPKGAPRPASIEALDAVLAVAPRTARAYIVLGAFAGLRCMEIAQVRGEDFVDGWLHLTGKGAVQAAVPVHPVIERLRIGWPAQGYWFPGTHDGHVGAETVSRTVSQTFRKAGHDCTAHQLRHQYATRLMRSGSDLRTVQTLMRHASLTSTEIYTEVSDAAKVAAVRRLGRRD